MLNNLKDYQIILASQSPRRHEMLKELGLIFEIRTKEVEEVYPEGLESEKIPVYLAELKAKAFEEDLGSNELVITADLFIFALSDKALQPILDKLSIPVGKVVHTAGSIPVGIFENYAENYGVFYPLQTFTISQYKLMFINYSFSIGLR